MLALSSVLFPEPTLRRSPGAVIGWWERRRPLFNIVVGATGLVGRECLRLVLADNLFNRIVVVVSAGLTVCEFATAVLPLKLESPPYVPVIEYGPGLGKAMLQEPAPTVSVAIQVFVPPSETVTLPVIVVGATAAPGALAATVTVKVADWPVTEGSGLSEEIVVVVSALFTV